MAAADQFLGITRTEVAMFAAEVFRAEYNSARRGRKVATATRLRHATVAVATRDRCRGLRECGPDDLAAVYVLLGHIKARRVTRRVDADGVTFAYRTPGGPVTRTVRWADIETDAAPAATT